MINYFITCGSWEKKLKIINGCKNILQHFITFGLLYSNTLLEDFPKIREQKDHTFQNSIFICTLVWCHYKTPELNLHDIKLQYMHPCLMSIWSFYIYFFPKKEKKRKTLYFKWWKNILYLIQLFNELLISQKCSNSDWSKPISRHLLLKCTVVKYLTI